jgi:hypothetical protein
VWGWTILICALLHFVIQYFNWYHRPDRVWMLTFGAWAYMVFFLRRQKRKEQVTTYTDEITGQVWLVFAVLMLLLGFMLGFKQQYAILYPTFLVLYGMPTFLSGVILRFKPLVIGAVVCWGLGIGSLFVQPPYQVLMLALAVIAAWIIPGYLLKQKFITENQR